MYKLVLVLWGVEAIRTRDLTAEEAAQRIESWKNVYGRKVPIIKIDLLPGTA